MKNFIILMAFVVSLAVPMVSHAGVPTDRVKTTVDKVITILKNPAMKAPAKEVERRSQIRQAVFGVFDFNEMAKRSMGIFWKDRTEAEKKEFVELFSDLLERSYINRIEGYTDEKIVYDKETLDADYAVVKTHFVTRRHEDIPVDYKLINKNGTWGVYDMVIENVSLVNNYRTQFNKIIRSSSYGELVQKMKNKREAEAFVTPGNGK